MMLVARSETRTLGVGPLAMQQRRSLRRGPSKGDASTQMQKKKLKKLAFGMKPCGGRNDSQLRPGFRDIVLACLGCRGFSTLVNKGVGLALACNVARCKPRAIPRSSKSNQPPPQMPALG